VVCSRGLWANSELWVSYIAEAQVGRPGSLRSALLSAVIRRTSLEKSAPNGGTDVGQARLDLTYNVKRM